MFIGLYQLSTIVIALYLKLATINCRGIGDAAKRTAFFAALKKLNIQIYCLQETCSKPQDEQKWATEWSTDQAIFNSNANTKKADSGTAILLNQPLLKFGPSQEDSDGRILTSEIYCDTFKFQLINIYGYTAAYSKNKRENFFEQLYNYVNPNLPIVLCGDFNCVEDPTRDRLPAKRSSLTESKQLSELVELCNLLDSHKKLDCFDAKFTFCSKSTKSRIDKIYVSSDIKLTSVAVLPNQFTDHETVITQFEIPLPLPRGKGYWKNNASVYYDEKFLEIFQQKWTCWKSKCATSNIASWWLDTKLRIKKLVIQHSVRLKNERLAIENNLKQQLNNLANHPNSIQNNQAYLNAKKSLSTLQIAETKKKLIKNQEVYQYSNNFSTKEFFKMFLKNREQTIITKLVDDQGIQKSSPGDILNVAKTFYSKLYQKDDTSKPEQTFFLNFINRKISNQQKQDLEEDINVEEIERAISSMSRGKAPGPDGLTIEFYQECWQVIKTEITLLLSNLYAAPGINEKLKSGYLSLIHKKGDKEQLGNYRPISLLNYDLKIFSKILANRLKLTIGNVVQEHQYAKPGSQISTATILLRDLYWTATQNQSEAFLVSIDFKKAFDSVDHSWLYLVLQKMGFPHKFIETIQKLNYNASTQILINGFQSEKVIIRKGVRQGDPLSLYLFLLSVEPMAAAINQTTAIQGLGVGKYQNIKCPSYADDLTLTLRSKRSVKKTFELIEKFAKASGLNLNKQKTNGLKINCSNQNTGLPTINWANKTIKVLGTQIGMVNSKLIWQEPIEKIRQQKNLITVPFQTWQAKAVLAKSKLLPQITYTAFTYPLNTASQRTVEFLFLNYLVDNHSVNPSMEKLQQATIDGGINYPNPQIYCDLFYIRNLFEYFKTRDQLLPFNTHTYIIEYEAGRHLSRIFDLKTLNNLPHRDSPSPFYKHAIEILKKYKITLPEMLKGKLRSIYRRIIANPNYPNTKSKQMNRQRWLLAHHPILPNYIKTFNYRILWNLLPLRRDPNPNSCPLCRQGQDTAIHLFVNCIEVKKAWDTIETILQKITNLQKDSLNPLFPINYYLNDDFKNFAEKITILLSITNYTIWQLRIKSDKENSKPSQKIILARLYNYCAIREKKEKKKADQGYHETFKDLKHELIQQLETLI